MSSSERLFQCCMSCGNAILVKGDSAVMSRHSARIADSNGPNLQSTPHLTRGSPTGSLSLLNGQLRNSYTSESIFIL